MSTNNLQQGTNNFKVRAKDEFDNWGAVSVKTCLIDTIPPGASHITAAGAVDTDHNFL